MNLILRNTFYAVGATMLFAMCTLNAATASFGDFVHLMQLPAFRNITVLVAIALIALDLATGTVGVIVSKPMRDDKPETPSGRRPAHVQD